MRSVTSDIAKFVDWGICLIVLFSNQKLVCSETKNVPQNSRKTRVARNNALERLLCCYSRNSQSHHSMLTIWWYKYKRYRSKNVCHERYTQIILKSSVIWIIILHNTDALSPSAFFKWQRTLNFFTIFFLQADLTGRE